MTATNPSVDAVNAIDPPTSFSAQYVGVIMAHGVGKAKVLLGPGPCGYLPVGTVMHISDIMKAAAFAFGERL